MIIWSGWGVLSALIAAIAFAGGVLLNLQLPRVGIPAPTGLVLAWLVGASANWVLGKRLNGRPGREMIDARTGQRVLLVRKHTLFWIPMQYYSIPMLVLGALVVVGLVLRTPPA
jgi:hypothetical protein